VILRFRDGVRGERERKELRNNGKGAWAPENGVLLHERSKALKGKPHERIRHETRPAGTWRSKAPRGRENLKAHAVREWDPGPWRQPLLRAGIRWRGRNSTGGARAPEGETSVELEGRWRLGDRSSL
jgi:hypothetical protein